MHYTVMDYTPFLNNSSNSVAMRIYLHTYSPQIEMLDR
jgi:hypothetical protein